MLKKSNSEARFPLYELDQNNVGVVHVIGECGARIAICDNKTCWAYGEQVEIPDDGTSVCCGACGSDIT